MDIFTERADVDEVRSMLLEEVLLGIEEQEPCAVWCEEFSILLYTMPGADA